MHSIGKKIKALRQLKGWSQGDIAGILNISIPAFSKIESDITDINMSRLKQIADVFEVDMVELISNQTSPDRQYMDELKKAQDAVNSQALKINKLQEHIINLYEELHKPKRGVENE